MKTLKKIQISMNPVLPSRKKEIGSMNITKSAKLEIQKQMKIQVILKTVNSTDYS